MTIELTVNGENVSIDDGQDLASGLREAGYTEVKCGCDDGTCGASKVFVDDDLEMACAMDAADAAGSRIETVATLGSQSSLHPIQQSFVDNFAVQCGFCTPGFVMSAKDLLDENPDPAESEVREAIDDVYCRCTGYQKPVEAILQAADQMRDDVVSDGGRNAVPEPTIRSQGETNE